MKTWFGDDNILGKVSVLFYLVTPIFFLFLPFGLYMLWMNNEQITDYIMSNA